MALPKKLSSIKRFGPRYGRTVKHKVGAIEYLRRTSTKCPYCNYDMVERLSRGIWHCKKCKAKFAGKAYTFSKKKTLKGVEEDIEETESKEPKESKESEEAEE